MIYILIVIYLLTLIYVFDYRKRNNGKSVWFTITCIVLICLSGLRYRIGGDTIGYMTMYDEFPTLFTVGRYPISNKCQPLWNLYVLICKTISSDFAFLQFTHAIILNVSLFVFIRKRIRNVFTFIFFYFILFYTVLNFEVLRESLAVAVSLMGFKYWEKKKWLPYYVFALIAYGFHVSAVILFILPFFRYIQLKLKTVIILALIFIFLSNILINLFMQTFNTIALLDYDSSLYKMTTGYGDGMQNNAYNLRFRLFQIANYVFIPLLMLLLPRYFKVKYSQQYPSLVFLFILIPCFSILSFIVVRFLDYVFVFYLFYLSDITIILMRKYRKSSLIVIFTIVFSLMSLNGYMSLRGSYRRYYPYHTIITKEKNSEREKMYMVELF